MKFLPEVRPGPMSIYYILGMIWITIRIQNPDYDPDPMDLHETFTTGVSQTKDQFIKF